MTLVFKCFQLIETSVTYNLSIVNKSYSRYLFRINEKIANTFRVKKLRKEMTRTFSNEPFRVIRIISCRHFFPARECLFI